MATKKTTTAPKEAPKARKAGAAAANHIVGKIAGVNADDSKVVAAEKAIAVAKSAGLPTRKLEQMLANYRKANPDPAQAAAKPTAPKADPVPAKAKVTKSDVISCVVTDSSGSYVCVDAPGQPTIMIPLHRAVGKIKDAAQKGKSYRAVADMWKELKDNPPLAKAAVGVDGHNAPHVAKALADQRKSAPKPKASPVPAKPEPKAGKNKAPSSGADYVYAMGKPFDRAEGTWTAYMVGIIQSHKDTASAKAAHASTGEYANKKLDFKWSMTKGFIKAK